MIGAQFTDYELEKVFKFHTEEIRLLVYQDSVQIVVADFL